MAKKTPTKTAKQKTTAKTKSATQAGKPKTKPTSAKKPATKKAPKKSPAKKKAAPAKKAVKKPVAKKTTPVRKKAAAATKSVTKKPAKKTPAKKAATKKAAVKKAAATKKKAPAKKPVVKKAAKKKAAPAKKAAAKKGVGKKAAVKPVPAQKTAAKKKLSPTAAKAPAVAKSKSSDVKKSAKSSSAKTAAPAATKASAKKTDARKALRSRILGRSKAGKGRASIAFTLDEVQEIAKTSSAKEGSGAEKKAAKARNNAEAIEKQLKAHKPTKVAAASLADILGFAPGGKQSSVDDPKTVPTKFRPYYKLLLELRTHLTGQIDQHSEETLKRSSKDDAGDLSSYGQHMADAGTDTFDRDFALSMVANEQEALSEIEAAITRIKNGSYGVCEATGEPIAKERLMAVPFTRFSAAAQKDIERNRLRVRTQAGLLADFGEDAGKITDSDDD